MWGETSLRLDKADVLAGYLVDNKGDNQRKTATFAVASLAAAGGFPGGMDFRLVAEGPADLTATMVRVIRREAR